MTLIDPQEYREAFVKYLGKGTPIRFETKNTKPTTHYIWRTRRDGKVRSSHAEREGQIFHGTIHQKADTLEKTTDAAARRIHICLKLQSLWKSLCRVSQVVVPLGAVEIL